MALSGCAAQYDINHNGIIEKSEAVQAVLDYFNFIIDKPCAVEVVVAYYLTSGDNTIDPTMVGAPTSCADCVSRFLSLLQRYDINRNGMIEQSEAVRVTVDYFANIITKDQAVALVYAYFNSCTFPIAPLPCTDPTVILTIPS